jgi:hypothetical protein
MSSLLKKFSPKVPTVEKPAWHPNFRVVERLPDTKPVRTVFFINGAAVLITLSLMILTVVREIKIYNLQEEAIVAQRVIAENKPASTQAIALFRKFQDQEKGVVALQQFLSVGKLVVSDFILHMGSTLPPGIHLNSIDYKPTSIVLRGEISGAADEASGMAYNYIDMLRKDKELSKTFDAIVLNSILKDASTSRIRFEAGLRFKVVGTKAQGGTK